MGRLLIGGVVTVVLTLGLARQGMPEEVGGATASTFREAAENGNAQAQRHLGGMYADGRGGVRQNYAEAAKWYRKAAEQDDAASQAELGRIFLDGLGVPQDYSEAFRWLRRAAEQEIVLAQIGLSRMYFEGSGVPQDFVRAHMWANIAAARAVVGVDYSEYEALFREDERLASMAAKVREANEKAAVAARKMRDSLANLMTSEQIAEAQKLAREWQPKQQAKEPR